MTKRGLKKLASVEPRELYTVDELAPLLKVGKRTLRDYCNERVFANSVKFRGQWRIPGCDVIAACPHLKVASGED